jgi:hypothetical protein
VVFPFDPIQVVALDDSDPVPPSDIAVPFTVRATSQGSASLSYTLAPPSSDDVDPAAWSVRLFPVQDLEACVPDAAPADQEPLDAIVATPSGFAPEKTYAQNWCLTATWAGGADEDSQTSVSPPSDVAPRVGSELTRVMPDPAPEPTLRCAFTITLTR